MRFFICLIILAGVFLMAGCGGSTAAPSATTTGTTTTAPTVAPSATTTTGTSVIPSTTTPSSTLTSTATTTTTAITTATTATTAITTATTATTAVTTTTATTSVTTTPDASSEELNAYLGSLMPVIARHIATKQTTTEKTETFAIADPGLTSVEVYRNELAAIRPSNESERIDASAIVPPDSESDFHTTVINAITLHLKGIDDHIAYYTQVLEQDTGDFDLFMSGADAFAEADNLWYNVVLPHLDEITEDSE